MSFRSSKDWTDEEWREYYLATEQSSLEIHGRLGPMQDDAIRRHLSPDASDIPPPGAKWSWFAFPIAVAAVVFVVFLLGGDSLSVAIDDGLVTAGRSDEWQPGLLVVPAEGAPVALAVVDAVAGRIPRLRLLDPSLADGSLEVELVEIPGPAEATITNVVGLEQGVARLGLLPKTPSPRVLAQYSVVRDGERLVAKRQRTGVAWQEAGRWYGYWPKLDGGDTGVQLAGLSSPEERSALETVARLRLELSSEPEETRIQVEAALQEIERMFDASDRAPGSGTGAVIVPQGSERDQTNFDSLTEGKRTFMRLDGTPRNVLAKMPASWDQRLWCAERVSKMRAVDCQTDHGECLAAAEAASAFIGDQAFGLCVPTPTRIGPTDDLRVVLKAPELLGEGLDQDQCAKFDVPVTVHNDGAGWLSFAIQGETCVVGTYIPMQFQGMPHLEGTSTFVRRGDKMDDSITWMLLSGREHVDINVLCRACQDAVHRSRWEPCAIKFAVVGDEALKEGRVRRYDMRPDFSAFRP